jgi:hypothetical protein
MKSEEVLTTVMRVLASGSYQNKAAARASSSENLNTLLASENGMTSEVMSAIPPMSKISGSVPGLSTAIRYSR